MKFVIGYFILLVITLLFVMPMLKVSAKADEQAERMYRTYQNNKGKVLEGESEVQRNL